MDEVYRNVTISHKELVDTLQVIHTLKAVSADNNNVDESILMDSLIYDLLENVNSTNVCEISLKTRTCFSIWLCLDNYRKFLAETEPDKPNYGKQLMDKFAAR